MEDANMAKRMLLGIVAGMVLTCTSLPFEANVAAAPRRAQRNFVPNELLVKFKPQTPGFVRAEINRGAGATVVQRFRADSRLELLRLPTGEDLDSAIAYYSTRADVEYVQRNFIYHLLGTSPDDYYYIQQWALGNVNAPAAWDRTTGRFNVVVAVIDTGVDYTHPDLALNIWTNPEEAGVNCSDGVDNDADTYVDDCRGWDFYNNTNDPIDTLGHGTQVAGVIGARGNNQIGVAGANWNVQIMPLKVTDASGGLSTAVAAQAIDYALAHDASVINASWGGPDYDPTLLGAIQDARGRGVLFVTAAGNQNSINDFSPFYPCNYTQYGADNVVCVTSTDENDNLAASSNYGATTVQLGAPGANILTTGTTQPPFTAPYVGGNGTSLAAAYVTGAAALLKGCNASLSYSAIRDILLTHTRDSLSLSGKTSTNGVVDFQKAFTDGRVAACDSPETTSSPVANPGGPYAIRNQQKIVQFDGTGSSDDGGQLLLYFWDFGDGTFAVGPQPSHSYSSMGAYTATLFVRDDQGLISSQSVTVNVGPYKSHQSPGSIPVNLRGGSSSSRAGTIRSRARKTM
jgi:subtilisin family serine protease